MAHSNSSAPKNFKATRASHNTGELIGAPEHTRTRHLTQLDLARRWCISPRTLERWRWLGQGPRYMKIGGRVVYRMEDIEAYEAEKLREPGR